MADTFVQFERILKALDYYDTPGLVFGNNNEITNHKNFIFNQTQNLLNIDGIYYVNDTPIIYFKYFSDVDEQQISNLHKDVWNRGTTPLLFVLLPKELRIYSAYKAPVLKNESTSSQEAVIFSTTKLDSKSNLPEELNDFSRIEIDSGNFWRNYANFFNNDTRINQHLLHDLKELRRELHSKNLDFNYAHNLIGRSLLVLYLEQRGFLNNNFFKKVNSKHNTYLESLSSKTSTYHIYAELENFFGTDIFPITDNEKKAVTTKHLTVLQQYLSNNGKKSDHYFWAYSYNIIPIEIICSIYEEFLYIEEKGQDLASFTPPSLANLMLNQVIPYDKKDDSVKVLDPACGSSIFLVESFKRLLERTIINSGTSNKSFNELYSILKENIYGFDYNGEALKFTAFCLYRTLLDYLEAIDLAKLPKQKELIGNNLVESDFFDSKSKLHKNKYDVIVGNPPWQSSYGDKAKEYLKNSGHPVGDKQISQVFLWQAGDLIEENGLICILMPSKGLLYNFNPKNIEFRNKFFKTFNVNKIINLSLFSNLLFENSKFPASIILYSLEKEGHKSSLTTYYTPKPSNKLWEFSTLVVDPSNVKRLPRKQILNNLAIWKIAFVGTGRDFVLVNYLDKQFPKIDYICEDLDWKYGEGFQLGGGDKNVNNDMAKMLNIPAKSIFPFYVDKSELDKLGKNTFHRPRDFALYKAPHTLVRGGQIYAAFINYDAVFTHAVMSFASESPEDANLLKLLAAYLNSSLVLYYLFLTSSTWCIERTDIHLAEYRTLPFTIPSDAAILDNVLNTYDELSEFVSKDTKNFAKSEKYAQLKEKLDNYIFDMFNLDSEQRQIILDVNKYAINYFQDYSKSSKSKIMPDSTNKPDDNILFDYAQMFCNTINKEVRRHKYKLVSTIYSSDYPLDVISFSLVPQSNKNDDIQTINDSEQCLNVLQKLDKMVLKQTRESLYTTRNVRIYEGSTFYLIKPSEIRYWTKTMALNDSDKSLKEILQGFR